ncbi:ExbD/TolR family protein [Geoalkalibacter subterraneus]|uniref:Biopolymer transporter ExbD n=1 Tax=Geoalkalibacter subterraneus TaxID=483547 RepID=A0A0B5FDR9_9BACT|nr:biopolymer transporter ExbD [Geoalkalibacter subterraneus]AJF06312.1 biopolymer transporter ExbD [Geoalkalibacter subterraneus]
MAFRRKQQDDARIDMTPMVDVVFLLLIFFMISTTFVETPGIDIRLPESSARSVDREPEEIKVYLTNEGEIFLGDEPTTKAQLEKFLEGKRDDAGQITFLLLADREARHGMVVELMDLARTSGFSRLAIGTEESSRRPRE